MSPIYQYQCVTCGEKFEEFRHIEDRGNAEHCGEKAKLLISSTGRPVVYEYFSENLGSYVTGPAQRARLMKEKGVEAAG